MPKAPNQAGDPGNVEIRSKYPKPAGVKKGIKIKPWQNNHWELMFGSQIVIVDQDGRKSE